MSSPAHLHSDSSPRRFPLCPSDQSEGEMSTAQANSPSSPAPPERMPSHRSSTRRQVRWEESEDLAQPTESATLSDSRPDFEISDSDNDLNNTASSTQRESLPPRPANPAPDSRNSQDDIGSGPSNTSSSALAIDQQSNSSRDLRSVSAFSLTRALLELQRGDKMKSEITPVSSLATFHTVSTGSNFFDAASSPSSEVITGPYRRFRLANSNSTSSSLSPPQPQSCKSAPRRAGSVGDMSSTNNDHDSGLLTPPEEDSGKCSPLGFQASPSADIPFPQKGEDHESVGYLHKQTVLSESDVNMSNKMENVVELNNLSGRPHNRPYRRKAIVGHAVLSTKKSQSSLRAAATTAQASQNSGRSFYSRRKFRSKKFRLLPGHTSSSDDDQAASNSPPSFAFIVASAVRLRSALSSFRRPSVSSKSRPNISEPVQIPAVSVKPDNHPPSPSISDPKAGSRQQEEPQPNDLLSPPASEEGTRETDAPQPSRGNVHNSKLSTVSLSEMDSELADEARDTVAELNILPERYRSSPLACILAAATAAGEERERELYEKLERRSCEELVDGGPSRDGPEVDAHPSSQPEPAIFDEFAEGHDFSISDSSSPVDSDSEIAPCPSRRGEPAFREDKPSSEDVLVSDPRLKRRGLRRIESISSFPSQVSLHVSPLQQHPLRQSELDSSSSSGNVSPSYTSSGSLSIPRDSRFREDL